jgi:hypothetical protein
MYIILEIKHPKIIKKQSKKHGINNFLLTGKYKGKKQLVAELYTGDSLSVIEPPYFANTSCYYPIIPSLSSSASSQRTCYQQKVKLYQSKSHPYQPVGHSHLKNLHSYHEEMQLQRS